MSRGPAVLGLLAAILAPGPRSGAQGPKHPFSRRYILVSANLNERSETDKVLSILRRAAAAHYNGLVLSASGGQQIAIC